MNLSGKKINFLGDSITYGVGPSDFSKVYHSLLASREGIEARNFGLSASCVARLVLLSYGEVLDKMPMCLRIEDVDPDADMTVIFGGTNDYGLGVPHSAREGDSDIFTFPGAMRMMLGKASKLFPRMEIVFMTPIHRLGEKNPCGFDGAPLEDYAETIREISAEFDVPVCDLFAYGDFFPDITEDRVKYAPDGLHPNDEGNDVIARRLAGFLKNL